MPDWLLQIVGIVAAGSGVYGAIRADLAAIREKAEYASEAATRAHERIDKYFENRGLSK